MICAFASTAGSTSMSMKRAKRSDIVSYSRPRSLPRLSPPPFATAIAMKAGSRRAGSVDAVRLSSASLTLPSAPEVGGVDSIWVGPS